MIPSNNRGVYLAPDQDPAGLGKSRFIKIAKIDPYGCRKAVIKIRANMDDVRRVVGSRHVGQLHVANIDNIPIWVCCARLLPAGPIWTLKDGVSVHGTGILFGNIGFGPADFPGDSEWLEEFVSFQSDTGVPGINHSLPRTPEMEARP